MLVALSAAAGCVDAASYLGLDHVFTANMTGNTVLLGIALGRAEWKAALRSGVALAGFVAGVGAGALIVGRGRGDTAWPPAVTMALVFECLVLAVLAAGRHLSGTPPGEALYPLISLSAFAMGVQSAAVGRLNVASVSTTYVTGTLTSLTRRLVSRLRPADPAQEERPPERGLELPAGVWFAYGAGAVAGGAAELRWKPIAISLPITLVAAVVVIATVYRRSR